MSAPDGYAWRPLRPDDAERWARLLADVEKVDRVNDHYTAEDLHEELTDPGIDLQTDTIGVLDGDELVACQTTQFRRGAVGVGDVLLVDGAVHPRHRGRGLGTELVSRARRRADALHARLQTRIFESNTGAIALFAAAGLAPARWWSELVRDLSSPIVPVAAPEGVEVRPLGPWYDADRWDEPLRAAHNAAFAGHWGSAQVSQQAWRTRRTAARAFRPAMSVAATVAGSVDVAGYVLAYEYAGDTAASGQRDLYVATVGTIAAWRGRGLAGALLTDVLTRAQADGYATSALDVDTQNATGALGVYERVGYALIKRAVSYQT